MNTISKTDWNMTHRDGKKIEGGIHYIQVPVIENGQIKRQGWKVETAWVPVKIKGVKKGEVYR